MRHRLVAVSLAAALAVGLALASRSARGEAPAGAEVGKPAPSFQLNDDAGKLVEVGGAATKTWTVLAFYPKAMTGGCTKEVCSIRDAKKDFEGLEATVYGISIDDVQACAQFVKKESLNFGLLSDPDRSAVAKYGAVMEGAPYAARYTYVIDPQGVLRHVDKGVKVASHGGDLVALLKKLKGS